MSAVSARRRHPAAAIVVLLLGLVALGSIYAAFAPASKADTTAATSAQVEEGKKLFAIGCASCHGLNGEGVRLDDGTVLGPTLVGVGAAAVDFQVGTGRMPATAPNVQIPSKAVAYTEEQISQLAAYVASLGPGPGIPNPDQYDPAAGNPSVGGELYRTNCAACHNTSGQGGALSFGKYAPKLTGVDPKHMYEAMITGPQQMPVFGERSLPTEDKQDIIAFLTSIEDEPNPGGLGIGRSGPVSEGLWGWIVGIGGLMMAAIWVAGRHS